MANLGAPGKGDKIRLMGMTAVKITDFSSGGNVFIHGYFTRGEVEIITVEGYIGGDTIISKNGILYPLRKEFDSDFYVIVGEE